MSGPAPGPLTAERAARIALLQLAPPTAAVLARLREHGIGPVASALGEAATAAGRPIADPERDWERAAAAGWRFLMPGDAEWPGGLDALGVFTAGPPARADRGSGRDVGVPFGLWARGRLELGPSCLRSAAVVGARAATGYGAWVAAELGTGLGERGATVISGAAFGIDAAAHRGALAIGAPTVAVVAGGIDRPYPAAHDRLLGRIAEEGLVISEAPLGQAPRREAFLRRNRLIAALSGGVVLVEAGLRSGARNTVAHARGLGRPRMAVPGPVTSALSAGCHALLREDPEARLITRAADVLEEIGRIGVDLAPPLCGPVDARDGLSQQSRLLLELLPARGGVEVAALARALDAQPGSLGVSLAALTSAGLIHQSAGLVRLADAARAPTRRAPAAGPHPAAVVPPATSPALWGERMLL